MLLIAMLLAAQPAPTSAGATEIKPEDKIVCRREEAANTRIRTRKICLKQSEWDRISKETQDDIKRSANQKSIPVNAPGQ